MTDHEVAAVTAAAFAISRYDWNNGISANPEVGAHQRAEATAALAAGASLWVLERIAQRFVGVHASDVHPDEVLRVRWSELAIALNGDV